MMATEAPIFGVVTGDPIPTGIQPMRLPTLIYSLSLGRGEEGKRISSTFEQIQNLLKKQVGGRLPQTLIEQLGFEQLDWQLVYQYALPVLFLGSTLQHPEDTITLAETIGTIALERNVSSNQDGRVYNDGIMIAGVGRVSNGSSRVMAVEYNPYTRQATSVDVSVSEQEFPCSTEFRENSIAHNLYHDVVRPIPSRPNTVYHIGGIVTNRMILATAVNGQYAHNIVFSSYDSTHQGDKVVPVDHGQLSRRFGFRVDSLDDAHRVSYQPPQDSDPALTSWFVDFPKKLE